MKLTTQEHGSQVEAAREKKACSCVHFLLTIASYVIAVVAAAVGGVFERREWRAGDARKSAVALERV